MTEVEANPNARFQKVSAPNDYPGKCSCCGSASKPAVSWGLRIVPGYGRVYLCNECVGEAATQFGWVSADTMQEMTANLFDYQAQVTALRQQIKDSENVAPDFDARVTDALIRALADDSVRSALESILGAGKAEQRPDRVKSTSAIDDALSLD